MARNTKFRIQYDDQEPIKILASFEDSEWHLIEAYLEYMIELDNTAISKKGGAGKISISVNENGITCNSVEIPESNEIAQLLHRLRPFILQTEPTFFNTIANILKRRITDEKFHSTINEIKSLFDGNEMSEKLKIISNGHEIITQKTLLMWLNSYEYHRDIKKRVEIDGIFNNITKEATEAIFLMLIYEKLKAVKSLACLLYPIIGTEKSSILKKI